MSIPTFAVQAAVPAPGETDRARIVSDTVYPNTAAAAAAWDEVRHATDPRALVLVMKPTAVRSGTGYRAGLRGFRLVSVGTATTTAVVRQVAAMNAATALAGGLAA